MRVIELHSPLRVVQRSKGRTATAAAAYRAAERIECERTGQVHDYTRKQGVEHKALLLPDNAPLGKRDAPTATISALAAAAGAWGVRVHDVAATRLALDVEEHWNPRGRHERSR